MNSTAEHWEPLARRYSRQKGMEPNVSLGYLATAGSLKAARLATWCPLGNNPRHEERHPRLLKRVPKHWHPPWDAIVEEEESNGQSATRASTARAL